MGSRSGSRLNFFYVLAHMCERYRSRIIMRPDARCRAKATVSPGLQRKSGLSVDGDRQNCSVVDPKSIRQGDLESPELYLYR